MSHQPATLILGVGNLLWADEGFGVRAIEALNALWEFPPAVTLLDGGTQGLYLLPHIQAAEVLIIFDAVDYGLAPGTLKVVEDNDVPSYLGAKKMSLHQTGFQEVLALAQLLGWQPLRLLLIGVQPQELEDYGGSLRPCVAAQIEPACQRALSELQRLGIVPAPRQQDGPILGPEALAKGRYEQERPSPEAAYRHGDARFLHRLNP